jgi:hypothetical protein
MSFSEYFTSKTPFKNVEEPPKTEMSDSDKKLMKRTMSITDKTIREQEYPGQYGVIIGETEEPKEEPKDAAPKMSPLEAGGYEGAADVVGAATYIPTAHMYTDMFNKIGQAAMDIESNMKGKEKSDEMKKWLKDNPTLTADSPEYKYTQVYGKPPKSNNKYKENDDGTFSLIT